MKRRDERITILQTFICGNVAGITSRTCSSPLEVIKLLCQVGAKETKTGLFNAVKNVYRTEGARGFFKGNMAACLKIMPYTVIQYSVFQKCKLILLDEQGRLSAFKAAVAGTGGGVVATLVTYPLDMVKTRLTVQHAAGPCTNYSGLFHAFSTIYAKEGLLSFYRGFSTSVLGFIPYAGATFLAYEMMDRFYSTHKSRMTPVPTILLNGCFVTTLAQLVSYPFDTIRKKMQVVLSSRNKQELRPTCFNHSLEPFHAQQYENSMLQAYSANLPNNGGVDIEVRGMLDSTRRTIKQQGAVGLWRGATVCLLKIFPYTIIMFLTFEYSKRMCLYYNGYTLSPFKDVPDPDVDQTLKPHELRSWVTLPKEIKSVR